MSSVADSSGVLAPTDERELMKRCHALAGIAIGDLASQIGWIVPQHMRQAKGFVGRLLECVLGAEGSNLAKPDFPSLGIELKSIPFGKNQRPRESTFVCHVSLYRMAEETWETSGLRRKLRKVLWVPLQADPQIPLAERRIGSAVLWSPTEQQDAWLQEDWEEIAGRLGRGEAELLTAHVGRVVQLRPKGANAASRSWALDAEGALVRSGSRAFYLRTEFTRTILCGDV